MDSICRVYPQGRFHICNNNVVYVTFDNNTVLLLLTRTNVKIIIPSNASRMMNSNYGWNGADGLVYDSVILIFFDALSLPFMPKFHRIVCGLCFCSACCFQT